MLNTILLIILICLFTFAVINLLHDKKIITAPFLDNMAKWFKAKKINGNILFIGLTIVIAILYVFT